MKAHTQIPDSQQTIIGKDDGIIFPAALRDARQLKGNSFFIVAGMLSVRLQEGLTDRDGERAWSSSLETGKDAVIPVGSSTG